MRTPLVASMLGGLLTAASAATLFEDGFEDGTLGERWTVSTTHDGRVAITTAFDPASGERHLVLDDQTDDAVASVAEATLSLNLRDKRNVTLSFKARSLGNEPDPPPAGDFTDTRAFDGVSISLDAGTTWRTVQSFENLTAQWTAFAIDLDAIVGGADAYGATEVRLRFSAYDNSPAPTDGIAIDDVSVQGDEITRAFLELPGTAFQEGSGPHDAFIVVSPVPASDLVFTLETSIAGQLSLPATVTVPAGETAAGFSFSVVDDSLFNKSRTLSLALAAPGVLATPASINIADNDEPESRLTIPSTLTEGEPAGANATLAINLVPTAPVNFLLTTTPPGYVSVPTVVTIQPGQTEAGFPISVRNNTRIEDPVVVTFRATSEGVAPSIAECTIIDDEPRVLSLEWHLTTVIEGETLSGTVRIPGTLKTDLSIGIESTPPGLMILVEPVTIKAGATEANIQIRAVNDSVAQPTRSVSIRATAPTFSGDSYLITVRDDDPAVYRLDSSLADSLEADNSHLISVRPYDFHDEPLSRVTSSLGFQLELTDGTLLPLETVETGTRSVRVTIPPVSLSPVRFVMTDERGVRGTSRFFEVTRRFPLAANDLVWDSRRNRLYASGATATGSPHQGKVVAIDPTTLQVHAEFEPAAEPNLLALSDDGERLYVSLNDGNIVTIDPEAFTALRTFSAGASPTHGPLHARDMVVVHGQPDVLVVLRAHGGDTPGPNSIAAYREGALLPASTPEDGPVCEAIEASEDPSVILGYESGSQTGTLRRLRLSDEGVAWEGSLQLDRGGYSGDFKVEGGLAMFGSGPVVDISSGRWMDFLPPSSVFLRKLAPELSQGRVCLFSEGIGRLHVMTYDLTSRFIVGSMSIIGSTERIGSLARWGPHGLAFRTYDSVVFLNSTAMVPGAPPVDLDVHIDIDPYPARPADIQPHVIRVKNRGSETAHRVILEVSLEGNNRPTNIVTSQGVADAHSVVAVSAVFGDLAPGVSATLRMDVPPVWSEVTMCRAKVFSASMDSNPSDNVVYRVTTAAGAPLAADSARSLPFFGNSLVYDPRRRRLWSTMTGIDRDGVGAVFSMNPQTGQTSEAIVIPGAVAYGSLAVSAGGRYLYAGVDRSSDVLRIDLASDPPGRVWIPIPRSASGGSQRASDIEVLDGDGTGILVATTRNENEVIVFDGIDPRAKRVTTVDVSWLEPTGLPGIFAGIENSGDFYLKRLTVTAEGVAVDASLKGIRADYAGIDGGGPWVLTTAGQLFDMRVPAPKWNLGIHGQPCVDAFNQRVYMVSGGELHGFDPATAEAFGTFPLPVDYDTSGARSCVRWGLDGFAIQGSNRLVLARWSQAIPEQADDNANGIPDRWEAEHLGPFGGDAWADADGDGLPSGIEYVFGTAAGHPTADPRRVSRPEPGVVRLVFPRRAGLGAGLYGFEASAPGLDAWIRVTPQRESVLSTESVDGVAIETVEAEFRLADPQAGFVRLVWLGR